MIVWAGVSVDPNGDTVYVSYSQHVIALNSATGEVLWQYSDPDNRAKIYAVPVLGNGTLYVGDYKGKLHAINAETARKNGCTRPTGRCSSALSPTSMTA